MPADGPGKIALDALDQVLARKPHKDDHCLSVATECLCVFRNHLIARQREAGATAHSREQLARLNSVLSVVLGGHFPHGDVPWGELERPRAWLAELVAEAA
jgi:hypothetical protein